MSPSTISFISTHQLTAKQITALRQLYQNAKHVDENHIADYFDLLKEYRPQSLSVLAYEKQHLVGFISVFFFYEFSCELLLCVDPSHRRQKIATRLLQEIMPVLHMRQVHEIIFSSPQGLHDEWLLHAGFNLRNTEYQMQHSLSTMIPINLSIKIGFASKEQLPLLANMDHACFHSDIQLTKARLHELLCSKEYRVLVAYHQQKLIGKAHLQWLTDGARLSDIAITPERQGQGFGSAFIQNILRYIQLEKVPKVLLNVETNNHHAMHIYTRLGFKMANAHDYWGIPLKKLTNRYLS